jgi:hypothetical protein
LRFAEFLKTTVLACAGAATALAAVTIIRGAQSDDTTLLLFSGSWWLAATIIGLTLGRGPDTTPPIARLLAGAKAATTLPEQQPGRILLNRLWPLLLATLVAGAVVFLVPQVAAVAVGFEVIWALSWRRQHAAVTAIEERDGVSFYVERTSPLKPIQLLRAPGFQKLAPPA